MKTFEFLISLILLSSTLCDNQEDEESITLKPDKGEKVLSNGLSNDECVRRIHRDCNYPTVFTDEELENVRQFLNYSYTVLADIKPDKPLCPKLHVRQDWKCLSEEQKKNVIDVWRQMYERGDVQRLTDLHVKTWPAWHKSVEFVPSHRWFCNEFERRMRTIDRNIALPYWDPYTYGIQAERSSLWDTFGQSGNYSNGYTVLNSIYDQWELVPSVRRHWSPRGTLLPWYTQEFVTMMIQSANSYSDLILYAISLHFPPHLLIGGYEGQYSVREAPYDCLFFLHHASNVDVAILKWQFQKKQFLTPLDYNTQTNFNQFSGDLQRTNILNDTLTGVPSVTIRETFWIGFGDYCFIPDQLVRPINNLLKGLKDPIPTAEKRLPQWLINKYFPAFRSKNVSALSHSFEEVGECNNRCLAIPRPTLMRDTQAGRRQFEDYEFDSGVDLSQTIVLMEKRILQFWSDLNNGRYCSPYVTTY